MGFLCSAHTSGLRQGTADSAKRVADLGTEQAHDRNHDESHQGKDDGVFSKPLTSFFWSE
jgi:hypothetical protein